MIPDTVRILDEPFRWEEQAHYHQKNPDHWWQADLLFPGGMGELLEMLELAFGDADGKKQPVNYTVRESLPERGYFIVGDDWVIFAWGPKAEMSKAVRRRIRYGVDYYEQTPVVTKEAGYADTV